MTSSCFKFLRLQMQFLQGLLPRVPVMDRYIISELCMPFWFGVGVFSTIGVAVGVLFSLVRNVTDARIPLAFALQIFLLQMPHFISFSFPMAVLLATLMTFNRLSANSELIALRGCGISVYRLVLSAIVFSLLVTGLTFAFNEALVPNTQYQATTLLKQVLNQRQSNFQDKNIFYQENGEHQEAKRLFYAQQFDGRKLRGLTLLDFSQKGLTQVVTAESATWNSTASMWTFFNGTIYLVTPDASYKNVLQFEKQQLQIPQDSLNLSLPTRNLSEMNILAAEHYLQITRRTGDEKEIRKLEIGIQQKYATPFMGVVFALVGAALGAQPRRTSTTTGFGISVLIIFGQYLFSFLTNALGNIGLLSPFMAAWLPTLVGFAIGGCLLVRVAR